jgi:hypothetical protein
MLFIVEFVDGTTAQVVATHPYDAKKIALGAFKDKLILSVRKAGLLEMTRHQSPPTEKP